MKKHGLLAILFPILFSISISSLAQCTLNCDDNDPCTFDYCAAIDTIFLPNGQGITVYGCFHDRFCNIWYLDADGDGYYSQTTTSLTSPGTGWSMSAGSGGGDCNDADPKIKNAKLWYIDIDLDGYGDHNDPGILSCQKPAEGFVDNNNDCDDLDLKTRGEIEWYPDKDKDTFGDPSESILSCTKPAGYVKNKLDCDDKDPNLKIPRFWLPDYDGDGYLMRDDSRGIHSCVRPSYYFFDTEDLANNGKKMGDCNDFDPGIHPDIADLCDGINNDCDFFFVDRGNGDQGNTFELIDEDGGCKDNDDCTIDYCHQGECIHETIPGCQNYCPECDLGDPCTIYSCNNGNHMCVQRPVILVDPLISGEHFVCERGISSYWVTPQEFNVTYIWSITSGEILAGQGTPGITVRWNLTNLRGSRLTITVSGCNKSKSATYGVIKERACSSNPYPQMARSLSEIEESSNNKISFYPNPANQNLNLLFNNGLTPGKINIQIFDQAGKLVKSSNENLTASEQVININTSSLPNGFYFLMFKDEQEVYIKHKFIIYH